MKFVNIPIFLLSLTIGLFYTYITAPRPNVIFVYPTPENINQIQYKDEGGTCFGFDAQEIKSFDDYLNFNFYGKHPQHTIEEYKANYQKYFVISQTIFYLFVKRIF